jgi:hypothetical protein
MKTLEVRIAGKGSVRNEAPTANPNQVAHCDLCGADSDAVASTNEDASQFACKACLRGRLEAMTLGAWLLKSPTESGIPWGKVSG